MAGDCVWEFSWVTGLIHRQPFFFIAGQLCHCERSARLRLEAAGPENCHQDTRLRDQTGEASSQRVDLVVLFLEERTVPGKKEVRSRGRQLNGGTRDSHLTLSSTAL